MELCLLGDVGVEDDAGTLGGGARVCRGLQREGFEQHLVGPLYVQGKRGPKQKNAPKLLNSQSEMPIPARVFGSWQEKRVVTSTQGQPILKYVEVQLLLRSGL